MIVVGDVLHHRGVHAAGAGAHNDALQRRNAHAGIHALAAVHSGHGAAVAQVAGNHTGLGAIQAQELAGALAHIAVAGAMEAIAAHMQALVVLIGHAVQEGLGRHGLMEGGIEHGHIGRAGHHLFAGLNAHEVGGIVQRAQRNVGANRVLNLLGDKHAGGKGLAAVQHAVAYGANLAHFLHSALFGVGQGLDHERAGLGMILDRLFKNDLLAIGLLGQLAALDADALHQALGQELLAVHIHKLIFQRGGTRVYDQDFHLPNSLLLRS